MAHIKRCLLFLVLSILAVLTRIIAAVEYTAAAFEHQPYFIPNPFIAPSREEALRIMKTNTAVYSEQAKAAHKQGAQIIVFPEDGLYGFLKTRDTMKPYLEPIPQVVNQSIIPCTDQTPNTEILQELSCIARDNSIALVANMGDIQYCTKSDPNCPDDGRYQYNTDVVFDNDGRLIAKYHKQHLYYEKQFNIPVKCEFVTFTTSFQVRFGIFTCFDMLFKDPAIDLVQTYGVKNIVFPTAWYKGFPSLISIEFQQAWSHANCVNLVAANTHEALFGSTGSGIYSCGDARVYTYNEETIGNRLIIAILESEGSRPRIHDVGSKIRPTKLSKKVENVGKISESHKNNNKIQKPYVPESPKLFKSEIMKNEFTLRKLTTTRDEISVCGAGLRCNLNYSLPDGKSFTENFAFGAFSGDNPNGFYWEVCLLVKCATSEESSCGMVVKDSGTVFQSMTLTGNFSTKAMLFPTAIGSAVTLFSPEEIKFTKDSISSDSLGKPLLSVALIGRVYTKDKPQI